MIINGSCILTHAVPVHSATTGSDLIIRTIAWCTFWKYTNDKLLFLVKILLQDNKDKSFNEYYMHIYTVIECFNVTVSTEKKSINHDVLSSSGNNHHWTETWNHGWTNLTQRSTAYNVSRHEVFNLDYLRQFKTIWMDHHAVPDLHIV